MLSHLLRLATFRRFARQFGAVSRSLVATLAITALSLVGIAGHEAFKPAAYKDPVGIPTLGYGETKGVKMGDTTTPERALVQLLTSIGEHAEGIKQCILVPLFQHEFDAYLSLAYNIGVGAFCNSTLVKLLHQGQYVEACKQILRWDKAGGRTLRGLTTRRQAEYQQCMGPA